MSVTRPFLPMNNVPLPFHCRAGPPCVYPFVHWWILELFPLLGYCESCSCAHCPARLHGCIFLFLLARYLEWNCWVRQSFPCTFEEPQPVFHSSWTVVAFPPALHRLQFPHLLSTLCTFRILKDKTVLPPHLGKELVLETFPNHWLQGSPPPTPLHSS